jgi:hypothetical protein
MMDDSFDIEETDRPEPQAVPDNDTPGVDPGAEQSRAPESESPPVVPPNLLPQQAPRYLGMAIQEELRADPWIAENTPATQPHWQVTIETAQQLVTSLKQEPGLWVSPLIRGITKTGDDALVLSQILYWHAHGKDNRPRARKMIRGLRYLYKTHVQLGKETGVPARRVKRSLKRLQKAGFIEVTFAFAEGVRTSHIRPMVPVIVESVFACLLQMKLQE